MVRRRKIGQLPASEWPRVLERYLGGQGTKAIAGDIGWSNAAVGRVVRAYLLRFGELTAGLGARFDRLAILDPALGSRLTGAMIKFLETYDAARRDADAEALDDLVESSDQLMRAIARMRMALERTMHDGRR
jgi:hypothetical protein